MVAGGGGGGSTEVARFHALLGLDARGFTAGMAGARAQSLGLRGVLVGGAGLGAALIGVQLGMSAISKIIGGSIGGVIEYETAFVGVQKTVELSAAEFKILDANIRRLATSIPVGRVELARIGQIAGQLGVEGVDDLTTFIETIAMIGPTTDLTTEEAAIGFARFSRIMNEPIANVGILAAQIVSLGNNFAATEPEILNFATRIAVAGNLVGFTSGEVLALGTSLAALGIRAELGGTAMQRALLTINQAVAESGENLELLAAVSGLSAEEFAEQWEVDAFGAFQTFLAGLGRAGDVAVPILDKIGLAGQRNMQALLALGGAGDLVADTFANQAAQAAAPLALLDEFGKVAATTASQMAIFKSEVRETADVIGNVLVDQLNAALPLMTDFVLLLRGEGAAEGGPVRGLFDLSRLTDIVTGGAQQVVALGTLFRDVATGLNPFEALLGPSLLQGGFAGLAGRAGGGGGMFGPGPGPLNRGPIVESEIDTVRRAFGEFPELLTTLSNFADVVPEADAETQAFIDRLAALLGATNAASGAEDTLRRAREDAVDHVTDVMTRQLVEAFITGGDAAVAIQRQTNAALLVEFEAQREGIQALTGEIAEFTFDMWLGIRNQAKATADAVETEMARLSQSVVSAFAQAAGGNLAGAIGSFGQIVAPDQLSALAPLLGALASGDLTIEQLNNVLQTLLGVAGAPFSPVVNVAVTIGEQELHDITVEAITEAEAVGALP